MNNVREEAESIVLALYESIWAISDAIGFNIEVSGNRVPSERVDVNSLALRLLEVSMTDISYNLKLLDRLEQVVKWDTIRVGQTHVKAKNESTKNL